MGSARLRRAVRLGAAALATIAGGLVLTLVPLGLPGAVVHFGGSCLWGAMVLLIAGALQPDGRFTWMIVAAAATLALATELFRLYHTPALDAFRLTLPGALLLGRVYNPWNIVAYWAGILAALPVYAASFRRRGGVRPLPPPSPG